jgi:hypothetical protein
MAEKIKTSTSKDKKPESAPWQGAFNAFGSAFEAIKRNPQPLLWFVGFYLVLSIISRLMQTDKDVVFNLADILYLVLLLAIPVYSLSLADGKQLSVKEILHFNAHKYFSIIGVGILAALIYVASIVLLIVPIIWTAAWFFATSYVVADKGFGPIAALKESKRLAGNHKAKVWAIIGVSILISIAAGIASLIPFIGVAATAAGTIWASVASAILYRWLQKNVIAEN